MYWFPWSCVNAFIVHNVFLPSMENTDRFLRKELFVSLQNNLVHSHTAGYCNEITFVHHIINNLLLFSPHANLQVLLQTSFVEFSTMKDNLKASWKKWKKKKKKNPKNCERYTSLLLYQGKDLCIGASELSLLSKLWDCSGKWVRILFFLVEKQMTHKNGLLAQKPVEQELIKKKQINRYKNLIVVTF